MTQPTWDTSPHLASREKIAAALERSGLDPRMHLASMMAGMAGNVDMLGYFLSITVAGEDIDRLAALLPGEPSADGAVKTVGGLIDVLSTMDRELPVMCAEDEEGNGFADVCSVEETLCDGESTFHTPRQWAAELANPDSRFDPVEDEPPAEGSETGDGVVRRVAMLWP